MTKILLKSLSGGPTMKDWKNWPLDKKIKYLNDKRYSSYDLLDRIVTESIKEGYFNKEMFRGGLNYLKRMKEENPDDKRIDFLLKIFLNLKNISDLKDKLEDNKELFNNLPKTKEQIKIEKEIQKYEYDNNKQLNYLNSLKKQEPYKFLADNQYQEIDNQLNWNIITKQLVDYGKQKERNDLLDEKAVDRIILPVKTKINNLLKNEKDNEKVLYLNNKLKELEQYRKKALLLE